MEEIERANKAAEQIFEITQIPEITSPKREKSPEEKQKEVDPTEHNVGDTDLQ